MGTLDQMKPRLKSLELHGYKTFAGRSLFEFPGNITAIVGPNGSGKSNIADAIRWVLGEQSYSLLRGKKTEDMIFLGSDQRPKAGMASATILFDNEEDWLPVDYSEVAIARRAYRDGSNEYLLNKQRVRLKDISELLAQSGLAERTYTIIGQGLVDAALSLRPEERRKFFEEAAGIGLFRSRREEALTRLDNTRRNLERVTDILGELEPRLRSLERQAKRVEEYERIRADLQVLLKDWYGYHWHNSQKELLRNREILKNQEEKVNIARSRRTDIEGKVDSMRTRLQELRNQLNEWHAVSAELHRQREQMNRELAVLEERLRAINQQEMSLKSDLIRDEETGVTYQEKLKELQADRDKVNQELFECREQLDSVQTSFTHRKGEREKLDTSLRQSRRQLVDLETRQVQLTAHQQELENRIETYTSSREHLMENIEKNRSALETARKKMEEVEKDRQTLEENAAKVEEQQKATKDKLTKVEQTRKSLDQEMSRIETELAKAHAQLDIILQAEQAFSGMGDGAKSLLTAVSRGKLSGKFRTVSSILEVPQELEMAIGAALGDQLDALLYDPDLDTEKVLSYLEADTSGRAMLIPFEQQKSFEKVKPASIANVLGLASDLVNVTGDSKKLVNFLLGQVVIVNDRRTARDVAQQLPALGKAVTLKGEVFTGSGVIIAGKESRSAVISRPRQKRDLEERITHLEEQRSSNMGELEKIEKNIDSLVEDGRRLDTESRGAQSKLQQANQAYATAEREGVQLQQQLEWQNSQVENLMNQVTKAENEIQSAQTDIGTNANKISSLNGQIQEMIATLRSIPIDELQSQLVHWNTSLAISERALKETEARYAEFKNTIAQNTSLLDQTRKRLTELTSLRSETDNTLASIKLEEEKVNEKIIEARQLIDPAETELTKLETEYSEFQHEYSMTQQSEANADRVYTQAQLEFARSRETLDNLRRRIEEDFGLVALEYSEDVTGPTPLPLEGVGQLTVLTELPKGLEESINRQRALMRRMGAINPDAHKEYLEVKERHEFLSTQMTDLQKADGDLRQIINELDEMMNRQFRTTFNAVAAEFKDMFTRLFGGGSARLIMTDVDNPTETGIDIEAKLPGRREQGLSLLSGGERSLTAVALVFSLLRVSPTPFCILDEVDAMLDEANVGRFTELLKDLSQKTQFIVITHNRNTVQVADVIYGVTMGRDSASQVISLRLDEISDEMVR
jgi:chromosome segregation protein